MCGRGNRKRKLNSWSFSFFQYCDPKLQPKTVTYEKMNENYTQITYIFFILILLLNVYHLHADDVNSFHASTHSHIQKKHEKKRSAEITSEK